MTDAIKPLWSADANEANRQFARTTQAQPRSASARAGLNGSRVPDANIADSHPTSNPVSVGSKQGSRLG